MNKTISIAIITMAFLLMPGINLEAKYSITGAGNYLNQTGLYDSLDATATLGDIEFKNVEKYSLDSATANKPRRGEEFASVTIGKTLYFLYGDRVKNNNENLKSLLEESIKTLNKALSMV